MCPDGAMNVDDQSRYEQAYQRVVALASGSDRCPCPYFGAPRCVTGKCRLCGGASGSPPGCPDQDGG
jgi:hypothetical protein